MRTPGDGGPSEGGQGLGEGIAEDGGPSWAKGEGQGTGGVETGGSVGSGAQ